MGEDRATAVAVGVEAVAWAAGAAAGNAKADKVPVAPKIPKLLASSVASSAPVLSIFVLFISISGPPFFGIGRASQEDARPMDYRLVGGEVGAVQRTGCGTRIG